MALMSEYFQVTMMLSNNKDNQDWYHFFENQCRLKVHKNTIRREMTKQYQTPDDNCHVFSVIVTIVLCTW